MLSCALMPRAFSGKIFDRDVAGWGTSLSVARAVDELTLWAAGSCDRNRAYGANCEHDWRVPRARVNEVWATDPLPLPDDRLDVRILDHVAEQNKTNLSFLRLENKCNRAKPVPSAELFNAMRLRGEKESRLRALTAAGMMLAKGSSDTQIQQALEALFPPGSAVVIPPGTALGTPVKLTDSQQQFLKEVFRPAPVKRAVWVTLFKDIKDRLAAGPDAWLAAVGVRIDKHNRKTGDPIPPQLFFALRYRKEYLTLVRPSVFEVHDYPEHFPNPPANDPDYGGHPIGLTDVELDRPFLKEFVHADFKRHLTMVVGWGWTDQNQLDLRDARVKHHDRLTKVNSGVPAWMKEPA